MSSRFSMPLRALATQTAVFTMIGLGLAAPASAAPGDTGSEKRNDTATTAKAEASEKKTSKASEQSRTRSEQSGQSSTKASTKASTKSSTKASTRGSGGSSASTRTGSSGSTKSESKGLDDDRHTPMGEQPVSNADQNTGGANGDCADDPDADSGYFCGTTRDKASGNGQGNGEAVGKPWQAHKGKADNKNPPGQSENDANNGYECDGNQGIAKGNPAHTSCETTTVAPPPGPPSVIPPGIGGVDAEAPPAVPPAVVKGVELLVPPAGVELYRPPAQAAPVQVAPGAAALPATGATPAMTALSALALGMLALGSGLLLYRRVTS